MRSPLGSPEADFLFFFNKKGVNTGNSHVPTSSPISRATAFLPPRLSKGERQHCARLDCLDCLDCLDWMRTNVRIRECFIFLFFFSCR